MTPTTNPIRVLHVDDDPDFAELAAEFLQRHDERITVETTQRASDGLERLTQAEFDCVVSDYDLPAQDGIEFLEAVREMDPDLPFIFYTGKGSEEVASEAISSGVTDYLQKEGGTSQYEVLANRIENAVEQRRTERDLQASEERYRRLIEAAPVPILLYSKELLVTYVNEAAVEFLEAESREQVLGKHASEFAHPDSRASVVSRLERTAHDRETTPVGEQTVITLEGTVKQIVVASSPGTYGGEPVVQTVAYDITQQKGRERKLEEQQADLRLFERAVEGSTDLLAAADPDYTLLFANKRFRDYHGLTEDDVGQVTLPEYLGEQWATEVKPRLDRALAGEVVRYQMQRPGPDGDDQTLDIRYYPLTDEEGTVRGAVAAMRDITELEHNQALIEALSSALPEYTFIYDDEGTYVAAITGWETGKERYLAEDLIGKNVTDVFPPETAAELRAAISETLSTGERQTIEYPIETETDPRWYEATLVPIPDGYQGDRAVLLTAHQITERREYERKLSGLHDVAVDLAASDSFEAVCERTVGASRGILEFDLSGIDLVEDGRLVTVATSAAAASEATASGPIDEGLAGFTYRTGRSHLIDDLEAHDAASSQGPYRSAISIPIGEYGVFQAADGNVGAFDQSDLEVAELLVTHATQALDRLDHEESLRRQNERLEEFAGLVSHDLRNPLNVARGRLELAMEDGDNEHLEDIARALDRMETLIDNMLSLARGGETVGETEAVSLSALVETCWRNVETDAAQLVTETDATIQADRSRLQQLLENLLRNAVEHGGPTVTVTVGDLPGGFYVEDDGPGLSDAQRERVSTAGHSAPDHETRFGLGIVHEVAAAHGWDVTVTEGDAEGTRFEFDGVQLA